MQRAFISFDFDNDESLCNALNGQAKNPQSPFSFANWSVKEPFDNNWIARVRGRIRQTDLTIVLCGEYTHTAKGVAEELKITREERKPYFLLAGYSDKTCRRPTTARDDDQVYNWTWKNLMQLIAGRR